MKPCTKHHPTSPGFAEEIAVKLVFDSRHLCLDSRLAQRAGPQRENRTIGGRQHERAVSTHTT